MVTAPVVVVCVRDPDASNVYEVYARQHDGTYVIVSEQGEDVVIHDIDCGYSDLGNEDEYTEWALGHLADALDMPDPVAASIRSTVESYAPDGVDVPSDDDARVYRS